VSQHHGDSQRPLQDLPGRHPDPRREVLAFHGDHVPFEEGRHPHPGADGPFRGDPQLPEPVEEELGDALEGVLGGGEGPGEAERPFVEDLPHEVGDHEVEAGELEVDAHGQAGPGIEVEEGGGASPAVLPPAAGEEEFALG